MCQELSNDHRSRQSARLSSDFSPLSLDRYIDVPITRPISRDHLVIRTQQKAAVVSFVAKGITARFLNSIQHPNMFVDADMVIAALQQIIMLCRQSHSKWTPSRMVANYYAWPPHLKNVIRTACYASGKPIALSTLIPVLAPQRNLQHTLLYSHCQSLTKIAGRTIDCKHQPSAKISQLVSHNPAPSRRSS